MNKLHRKIEYALMALQHLKMATEKSKEAATPSQTPQVLRMTAKSVSEAYHVPFDAVARSLQLLAQKGILKSEQGAQGGYQLARSLEKISLLELIEAIEGPTQIAKCLQSDGPCDVSMACNIVSPVQALNARLNDFYKGLSLEEVLQ